MKKSILMLILIFFILNSMIAGKTAYLLSQNDPVGQKGTISFLLHTDKTYSNGKWEYNFTQTLVELPGLATCLLQRNFLNVGIFFLWAGNEVNRGFHIELIELPGPESYFLQFTWDAEKGLSEGYINGISLRCEGVRFEPWEIQGKATRYRVPNGPNRVTNVQFLSRYMPRKEAIMLVPEELLAKGKYLLGLHDLPAPLDIRGRKGKLLYASKMNDQKSVRDWILEGPGEISFEDNKMIMRSKTPNPPTRGTGHVNYWCPVEFPESFIVEWEFEPLKKHGLSIIFFAAKGENGEDIFDPVLPKRNGHYPHYTTGSIMNYHIIYFSNLPLYQTGNIATRMRKSNKFSDIAFGPISIKPNARDFQQMRLIKDRAHIQLLVNGKLCLDFTDPGEERWGPALTGGKIGLRQMAVTVGAYKNFQVWEFY